MLDCIRPELSEHIESWASQVMKWPVIGSKEWVERVILSVSAPETAQAWKAAESWWCDDPLKGQHYLSWAVRGALTYQTASTPNEAIKWRETVLKQLEVLQGLVRNTPDQYMQWWGKFGEAEAERITGLQSAFMIEQVSEEALNNEGIEAALLPQDSIEAMIQSLLTTSYKQGVTPLKPNSAYANRSYFVRSLSALIKPVTNDWPNIVCQLATGVFALDLKLDQVLTMAENIEADDQSKKSFEGIYYPRLKAGK